ncbi:MAG: hypothetical protein RL557_276 [archaeon]
MFHKIRILAQNSRLIKRLVRKTRKTLGCNEQISNIELVRKYAPNKSFADIGALWGINGLNSFIAEESGATKIIAVDVYPANKEFLDEQARRNSKVQFFQGDINLLETSQKIGLCDVVLCSGVLYHTPDPVHLLASLRTITRETLILNTASVPEMPGFKNTAVFYPFLNKNQRKIWDRGIGSQKAITGPYEPENGYGNWFWGMSPSCIESMLGCVGFEVMERSITSFNSIFICKAVSVKFTAESGEWNTPKEEGYVKLRR